MIGAARSANAPGPGTRHVILAGIIGNVLEWYDFSVHGYFAAILGRQLFPSGDSMSSLIAAFGADGPASLLYCRKPWSY